MRPVLGRLDRTVLGTLDGADALLQSGILAWTVRHWWDPAACVALPIFYPATSALMSMDTLLGQALMVAPVAHLGDPTPALLYNLAVIGTLLLTALAGAALWLAGGDDQTADQRAAGAGLTAVLLLGSPFTTWQLGMLNQISPPWVVMLLVALWRGWRRFRHDEDARPWWWVAAGCLAMQAAWGWYGFADATFVLGALALVGAAGAVRRGRSLLLARQTWLPLACAAVAVVLLAWPYVKLHDEVPEYTRSVEAVHYYSADVLDIGGLGPHRWTWSDLTGAAPPAGERALLNTGSVLHPGWLPLALAAVGLWRWRRLDGGLRRLALPITVVGLVGAVLSFGDSVGVPAGSENRVYLPFHYLREWLMPYQAFRAPVRFIYLAYVAAAWWAAVGVRELVSLAGGRWRPALAVGLLVLIWAESVPVGLLAVPVPVDGRADPSSLPHGDAQGAVLTLPAPATEAEETAAEALWLHRALATGHPVTGGLSGWVPPVTRRLRACLAACERGEHDAAALVDSLRRAGVMGAELRLLAPGRRVVFWREALRRQGYPELPSAPGHVYFPLAGRAAH